MQKFPTISQKNKDTLPTNMAEAELRKNVEAQLKQQKLGTASQAWLDQLNKDAKINYFRQLLNTPFKVSDHL